MKQYIALIRKEKGSCYGVDFPDFPGCITAADTLDEAQAQAVEVLSFHTENMAEEGLRFPKPSSLDEVLNDPDNKNRLVVAILVSVEEKKSQKVRVDVTISEGVRNQVDQYVKQTKGVSRSSFFTSAALERLQRVNAFAGHQRMIVTTSSGSKASKGSSLKRSKAKPSPIKIKAKTKRAIKRVRKSV